MLNLHPLVEDNTPHCLVKQQVCGEHTTSPPLQEPGPMKQPILGFIKWSRRGLFTATVIFFNKQSGNIKYALSFIKGKTHRNVVLFKYRLLTNVNVCTTELVYRQVYTGC